MQKRWKKDALAVAFDGLLNGSNEGAPDGAPKYALNDLRKYAQEATTKFEGK